jgi:hypothetical protein
MQQPLILPYSGFEVMKWRSLLQLGGCMMWGIMYITVCNSSRADTRQVVWAKVSVWTTTCWLFRLRGYSPRQVTWPWVSSRQGRGAVGATAWDSMG